jgi:hypothetical protein
MSRMDDAAIREAMARASVAAEPPWGLKEVARLVTLTREDFPRVAAEAVARGSEVEGLRAEVERLTRERDELAELHRMREAAICVAAQCNTPESAKQHRIEKGNPYWTLAYSDVCAAVDREMALRAAALPEDAEERIAKALSANFGHDLTNYHDRRIIERVTASVLAALRGDA